MKFVELFAGIGGFRLGLEKNEHECVWVNEWLDSPASIYAKNFIHEPNTKDIRTVVATDIPDHELIVGGFPCATFSYAGKRTGLSNVDTRGTLFYEICRIAHDKRTPYILLENVKGLLNHDDGKTFAIILLELDKLGYDVQWELLNSKDFGVPQNRERVFIFASKRGCNRPKIFPIKRDEIREKYGTCKPINVVGMLHYETTKRNINNKTIINQYLKDNKGNFTLSEISKLLEIPKTTVEHYFRVDTSGAIPSPQDWLKLKGLLNFDDSFDWEVAYNLEQKKVTYELTRRVYDPKGCMPTLTASNVPIIQEGETFRYLTPVECERLQGLPDNWTKFYQDGSLVSDNERYERVGRSVTIPIIYEIGKRIKNL